MDPASVGTHFSMIRDHLQLFVFLLFGTPALSFVSIKFWIAVGSSRVDLQACKLEYSIVSPK